MAYKKKPGIKIDIKLWKDDCDKEARHWAVFNGNKLVAAARLSIHNCVESLPDKECYSDVFLQIPKFPIGSFNHLVVAPEFWGKGVSKLLDVERMRAAAEMGCASVVAVVRGSRINSLEKSGFCVMTAGDRTQQHPILSQLGPGTVMLFAFPSQTRGTINRMGWSSELPNKYSQEFIRFAETCTAPVLDIGAAYGAATIPALMNGAQVYANDLNAVHLDDIRLRVKEEQSRLILVQGRFPDKLDFPLDFFDAIHASNILHFLRGDELVNGITKIFKWLRPGGNLYLMLSTPFAGLFKKFIPVFMERKKLGVKWPGEIENVREYTNHYLIPDFMHLMDEDVLLPVLQDNGFIIEKAEKFTRSNLPAFYAFDGRENLGVIARKPA
ncbi:MAG: GNAT family N-acetyltransferase [Nitrospirae bacterium]|nr:GNAT family N-acetyltransferase [Nitrospirota bacterium]